MTLIPSVGRAADTARQWLEVDPDPVTRAETERILAGDHDELDRRFGDRLTFGTAGIRGPRGAGPMRMNRLLVRSVASAIADVLLSTIEADPPLVVIGFDARHESDTFAEDTARVLASRGVGSLLLPGTLPTPVLAYAVRECDADAGVMVTASHNPAADSGYKVYWGDGAQIVPPIDAQISASIGDHPPAESDLADIGHPLIGRADDTLADQYRNMAASVVRPGGPRSLSVVYTPLHGVGRDLLTCTFEQAGFDPLTVVASQGDPDPDFPTLPFPNPEEPGALDAALNLATETDADLVVANDPDADRLAVAVPSGGTWRILTGDEIGALLAEHVLANGDGDDRLVVTTVVSSRLLIEVAAHHGVHYAETLTGFKWIVRPGLADRSLRFVFGYEEALGYATGDAVRDKDGITAALLFAELAAATRADGRTVCDLLNDLWRRHGVHRTGLWTKRFDNPRGVANVATQMAALRAAPPTVLADRAVNSVVDLAGPGTRLPITNALILEVDGGRVVVRPSGTEPMVKAYAEVVEPVDYDCVSDVERLASEGLSALLDSVSGLMEDGADL
ncbi:MAG: phospho-sugar mutase [Actinomycetota bacterium]|nr:phospho-sugar mutase [Actinomycetota bacterium]